MAEQRATMTHCQVYRQYCQPAVHMRLFRLTRHLAPLYERSSHQETSLQRLKVNLGIACKFAEAAPEANLSRLVECG